MRVWWAPGCVAFGMLAMGCGGSSKSNTNNDNFDRPALIQSWANDVILPSYAAFVTDAIALRDAVASYNASMASDADAQEQALNEAQDAWRLAMVQWQKNEALRMGPAGSSSVTGFKGGEDLRDKIYSWPTVSSCRVDQELVSREYDDDDFFQSETVNVYGMAALEYLLFNESLEHSCPSQVALNESWDALSESEIIQRRAKYAERVAGYVLDVAETLADQWSAQGGNFVEQFVHPGVGDSVYDDERCVIDEVFASIFYVEFTVKDMKLGIPVGVRPECTQAQCPEAVESRWSAHSKENILANYAGFELVFWGKDGGLGFDDYLEGVQAQELEARIRQSFDAAKAAADAIPGSLEDAVVEQHDLVLAAYTALKGLTDILKTELVSTLSLRVPAEGAGDND